jgi:hypothetical protein
MRGLGQILELIGVHPETGALGVLLRSEATKNLEILRCAQDDNASVSSRSLS